MNLNAPGFALALALTLAGCCSTSGHKRSRPPLASHPDAFVSLFNGRDLDGWVVLHGGDWIVENGELIGRNGVNWTTNPEESGSWLRTAHPYTDFVLELEYAINARGNSGIFIRSALDKNPAFTGHEMQILDDANREIPAKWSTGALYDVVAASKVMSRPAGEWNQVRITATGPRIQIELNGTSVIDHEPARSLKGYIGLQNHDDKSEVRFRNIRIRSL